MYLLHIVGKYAELQFVASKLNAATFELVMGQADFAWLLVGF